MKTNEKKQIYLNKKIGFVSLGCDKNRVDTEKIITNLCEYGFKVVSNIEEADIVVINTCSFLLEAREESIKTIFEMTGYKNLEKIVVAGCLPLLEKNLDKLINEVDCFIVPEDYNNISKVLYSLYDMELPNKKTNITPSRITTTPKHYAYLKISDGCNNFCTFCKIPYIRGRYTSVPMERLVEEAKKLVNNGVKELIIVAQDVTRYGIDIYNRVMLVELLQELSKIEKLKWIRLLYCYPDMIDEKLIDEIKNNEKIVKYIDIPLQHISDKILKLMGRRSNSQSIKLLIKNLKSKIPEIKIRSTFMVGFPGENYDDYNTLKKFMVDYKLDNVGFFKYSREDGTKSYSFSNQVSPRTKSIRLNNIQKLQNRISKNLNESLIGDTFNVVIDDINANNNIVIGRTYFQAPDIDFFVSIKLTSHHCAGDFINVKIIGYDSENYCLLGEELLNEFTK